jgi:hypothetical protein
MYMHMYRHPIGRAMFDVELLAAQVGERRWQNWEGKTPPRVGLAVRDAFEIWKNG